MITGLSIAISRLMTIPNAASCVCMSGRRAMAACRIGPSALISPQLAARGSQNRRICRCVNTAVGKDNRLSPEPYALRTATLGVKGQRGQGGKIEVMVEG